MNIKDVKRKKTTGKPLMLLYKHHIIRKELQYFHVRAWASKWHSLFSCFSFAFITWIDIALLSFAITNLNQISILVFSNTNCKTTETLFNAISIHIFNFTILGRNITISDSDFVSFFYAIDAIS